MAKAQPPGPVKLKPTDALQQGLQKKGKSLGRPVVTFKPGLNYGKKASGGKY